MKVPLFHAVIILAVSSILHRTKNRKIMKKKSFKNLVLHKKTISNLENPSNIKGGANTGLCLTGTPDCMTKSHIFVCCPQEPEPVPVPLPDPTPASVFPKCSAITNCPM
jgi:hypothetical protein